ncbi:hypothetical protein [Roseburia sp. 1XD42-34]|uniref:hypothetical protein n=1 Tax=Roseburia sp. 1XD42-34 TaxID=2305905 RepID=UPI000EA0C6F0|nr:hypothetical protein [Roseburia sp. 1XD42-34]NBJ69543.1 hypothetical protein [Roseburia sp. 1XD42-34]RKI78615.1 hypothetical protein D7V87_08680 [Clostridium sp. 1xD42-85]
MQGCNNANGNASSIDRAAKKVSDLFELEDEETVKEWETSKIKDSTDQEQVSEAQEAIDEIDMNTLEQMEDYDNVFSLRSAVLHAQNQIKERKDIRKAADNRAENEQIKEFIPDEDDVVWKNNKLKNKDMLEEFMKIAGENGKNNTSEIRVVKDEGEQGVLIYDLKSMYDKDADQSWILVTPDDSYYSAIENEVQDVFNSRQQCGYMEKDEQEGYYKLFECRTHWEYRLLPTGNL